MGSVEPYETSGGRRYRVRYRDPDRRSREKAGFSRKTDAEEFLATVVVSRAHGDYIDPNAAKSTIGVLGAEWLVNQTHLKPSTYRPVEIAWRLHVEPIWGRRRIGDVRHSDVQGWLTKFGDGGRRSATTVLRAHGVLAAILDVAVRDRRLLSNPARGVNLPRKIRKEHNYLDLQQLHRLADASGDHAGLVLLLAYTGLRWGEAIGLRVKDLDMVRRRINITVNAVEVGGDIEIGTPKSHKRRTVPFPRLLEDHMAAQRDGKGPDDLLFSDRWGQHLRRTRVSGGSRSWFKSALVTAELEPMTIHDLRHTAASLAVSAGANVKAVQRMLGHASAAMTLDVYADLFDDDLNAISDRLDEAYQRTIVGVLWGQAPLAIPQEAR
jgi:integrase